MIIIKFIGRRSKPIWGWMWLKSISRAYESPLFKVGTEVYAEEDIVKMQSNVIHTWIMYTLNFKKKNISRPYLSISRKPLLLSRSNNFLPLDILLEPNLLDCDNFQPV